MIALVLWLVAFGILAFLAVKLVRNSERRLGKGPSDYYTSIPSGSDPDGLISAYLTRVAGELVLPAADVAEVRVELIDHLSDSIASLEAEGMDHETAVREALGRLGPAAELGRQLRAAHQSTRRLLAGAGGGVFTAAGGFVVGYIGGLALAYLLLILGAACVGAVTLVGLPVPDFLADHGGTINSLMFATTLLVAAGVSTRYAVRTSAGLSRRAPQSVAIFWAVAAALLFGWLALFGMQGPQSWPGIVEYLCVPVVAVGAAFIRIDRPMPHAGRWALLLGVGGMLMLSVTLLLALAVSVQGSVSVASGPEPDMHFDTVAPMAPAAWLPDGSVSGGGWTQSSASGTSFSDQIDGPTLAKWHDLRFEGWRALGNGYGVDTRYSTALIIQPASQQGTTVSATLHFERMRNAGDWWVFLTGVGPDGHRYRLEDSGGGSSVFNGSVWDWITAPQ